MSLQATLNDANLAAYAPFVDRHGGTSLVRFVGSANMVTVQIHPVEIQAHEMQLGTGFHPFLSLVGRQMRARRNRPSATLRERVQEIRNAFGLNIKQLADVMQVTRVTIYDWIRQDNMSILREGARKRLNDMYILASVWGQLPAIPGLYLDEPIDSGATTLSSLLKRDELLRPLRMQAIHQMLLQANSIKERHTAYKAQQIESIEKGAAEILANPQDYGLETD